MINEVKFIKVEEDLTVYKTVFNTTETNCESLFYEFPYKFDRLYKTTLKSIKSDIGEKWSVIEEKYKKTVNRGFHFYPSLKDAIYELHFSRNSNVVICTIPKGSTVIHGHNDNTPTGVSNKIIINRQLSHEEINNAIREISTEKESQAATKDLEG